MNVERKIAQKNYLKNAGITLIALVITIIILLILAGVSIATLTGNNGILTQANDAKTETRANSVKEARDLWETNKTMDQRTGTSTAQTLEQLVDDLTAQGLLTEDEKDKIIGNEAKGIEAQYGITIGKTVITFSRPIAKVEPDNISDWEYTIDDDGFVTITCYKGSDTKVIIPNSINGVDVKRVDKTNGISNKESRTLWADNICNEQVRYGSEYKNIGQGSITEVIVSEGIEEIGNSIFSNSKAMEKLILPSTLRKLGSGIIYGSSKLYELNIPYGITTIEDGTFQGDYSEDKLESITIPESVISIGMHAFAGRYGLKSISIPKSVTSIGEQAFRFCNNLTSIEVAEENKNYKSVDGLLYNKEGTQLIKGVNKENIQIAEGTKIISQLAFEWCRDITNVIIPDSVEIIKDNAFYGCDKMKNVIMSKELKEIGNRAFSCCSLLTKINIPNKVKKIGEEAFYSCTSLNEITIPESVDEMGSHVFNGDTITVNVYFEEGKKPEKWNDDWNSSWKDTVTVNYITE